MGKALVILLIALSGCAHDSKKPDAPRIVWCDHNKPTRPSQAAMDAMSRAELDDMNLHNRKGTAWCGWKA
jgi:hypothetical protein